jgi:flagellar hook-length control protein FliK
MQVKPIQPIPAPAAPSPRKEASADRPDFAAEVRAAEGRARPSEAADEEVEVAAEDVGASAEDEAAAADVADASAGDQEGSDEPPVLAAPVEIAAAVPVAAFDEAAPDEVAAVPADSVELVVEEMADETPLEVEPESVADGSVVEVAPVPVASTEVEAATDAPEPIEQAVVAPPLRFESPSRPRPGAEKPVDVTAEERPSPEVAATGDEVAAVISEEPALSAVAAAVRPAVADEPVKPDQPRAAEAVPDPNAPVVSVDSSANVAVDVQAEQPVVARPMSEAAPVTTSANEVAAPRPVDAGPQPMVEALPRPTMEPTQSMPMRSVDAAPTDPRQVMRDNGEQLIRHVRTTVTKGGGDVQMRLDPPTLGSVVVRVRVVEGTAQVALITPSTEAANALGKSLQQLKHALEATGLNVDRLNVRQTAPVDAGQQARQDSRDGQQDGRQQDGRRQEQQTDADGRRRQFYMPDEEAA